MLLEAKLSPELLLSPLDVTLPELLDLLSSELSLDFSDDEELA